MEHKGGPTVILAKTVKGYGLGKFEGRNSTHQQKKLNEETVEYFRTRFEIPIPDDAARDGALYRPPDSSPEIAYHARAPARAGRISAAAQAGSVADQSAGSGLHRRIPGRFERAASFEHDGVRPPAGQAAEDSGNRQENRADRPR